MKSGANASDIAKIRRFHAEGKSPKEISKYLAIPLATVKSFVDIEKSKNIKSTRDERVQPEGMDNVAIPGIPKATT